MTTDTRGKIGHVSINIEGKRLYFQIFSSTLIDSKAGSPALFRLRKMYKYVCRNNAQKQDLFTAETLAQEVAKTLVEMLDAGNVEHISPFAPKGTYVRVDTASGYALTHIKRAPYKEDGQYWVDLCGFKERVNIELVHKVGESVSRMSIPMAEKK